MAMRAVRMSAIDGYGAFRTIWNLDRSPFRSTPFHSPGDTSTVGPPDAACISSAASLSTGPPPYTCMVSLAPPTARHSSLHCRMLVVCTMPFSSGCSAMSRAASAYAAARSAALDALFRRTVSSQCTGLFSAGNGDLSTSMYAQSRRSIPIAGQNTSGWIVADMYSWHGESNSRLASHDTSSMQASSTVRPSSPRLAAPDTLAGFLLSSVRIVPYLSARTACSWYAAPPPRPVSRMASEWCLASDFSASSSASASTSAAPSPSGASGTRAPAAASSSGPTVHAA